MIPRHRSNRARHEDDEGLLDPITEGGSQMSWGQVIVIVAIFSGVVLGAVFSGICWNQNREIIDRLKKIEKKLDTSVETLQGENEVLENKVQNISENVDEIIILITVPVPPSPSPPMARSIRETSQTPEIMTTEEDYEVLKNDYHKAQEKEAVEATRSAQPRHVDTDDATLPIGLAVSWLMEKANVLEGSFILMHDKMDNLTTDVAQVHEWLMVVHDNLTADHAEITWHIHTYQDNVTSQISDLSSVVSAGFSGVTTEHDTMMINVSSQFDALDTTLSDGFGQLESDQAVILFTMDGYMNNLTNQHNVIIADLSDVDLQIDSVTSTLDSMNSTLVTGLGELLTEIALVETKVDGVKTLLSIHHPTPSPSPVPSPSPTPVV